jgi:hypothetical protein
MIGKRARAEESSSGTRFLTWSGFSHSASMPFNRMAFRRRWKASIWGSL